MCKKKKKKKMDIEKAGIAQLVERPTEKSGAILTRVRVPGAARDFSPRVKFQLVSLHDGEPVR